LFLDLDQLDESPVVSVFEFRSVYPTHDSPLLTAASLVVRVIRGAPNGFDRTGRRFRFILVGLTVAFWATHP